ncbi:MAG: lipoate--protein ligase family protein [Deltaproteobacteria bacterium]|nr:lipoate--protein ligase family protein [Deltaproteobacteria bacterium]
MTIRLYDLGKIPWDQSQLIYHALAGMGREALCLVSPATPYVCLGLHQDLEQEVDLTYCEVNRIPIFRRDLGGGAVYLDGDQLFFQLILRRDNPLVPEKREAFYRKFLQPPISVYRHIGIPARYRPINDVVVGTRKISGTGASEIGDCVVFVGNLIIGFDYETMCRVLKVPDEKFRDKVKKTLRENLSTIRRELGEAKAERWNQAALSRLLAEAFQKLLGRMKRDHIDSAVRAKMDELGQRMLSKEWLYGRRSKHPLERRIKIRAGTDVVYRVHKAQGGLIRADFEVREGKFSNVHISGDFFCFPKEGIEWLESVLEGQPVDRLPRIIERFFEEKEIEVPGIRIADWITVLETGYSP